MIPGRSIPDDSAGALAAAAELGIHAVPVPTPFAVGDVNAYLLEGSPLTLLDSGPNVATAMRHLERALAELGHRLEDIELLLITHPHADHMGLAQLIAERAGATVGAIELGASYLERFHEEAKADDDYQATVMIEHGIDKRIVQALRSVARRMRAFGADVAVTQPLHHDDRIAAGGLELDIAHAPGHSPADTVFYERGRRILFSGDHLLSRISSNALVTRPLERGWDGSRPQPLVEYRRSLLATRALDADVVLGGHGPAIPDHHALIDRRLAEQARRSESLLEILRSGPASAHDLARTLWGDVAFTQAYLTLSEVLGHLDLLIVDGLAIETRSAGGIVFEAC